MLKILRFCFSRLKKSDFHSTFYEVISITEKHNPAALHLTNALARIKAGIAEAALLVVPEKKNPVTDSLVAQRVERNGMVTYLFGQTRVHLRSSDEGMRTAAKEFLAFLKRMLTGFGKQSYSSQLYGMEQFFGEFDGNDTLVQASVTLGLTSTIDNIRTICATIKQTYELKRVTKSVRSKMRTTEIKNSLSSVMTDFFNYIELASKDYPELDYKPLINELNVAIQAQRMQVMIRSKQSDNSEVNTDTASVYAEAAPAVNAL